MGLSFSAEKAAFLYRKCWRSYVYKAFGVRVYDFQLSGGNNKSINSQIGICKNISLSPYCFGTGFGNFDSQMNSGEDLGINGHDLVKTEV